MYKVLYLKAFSDSFFLETYKEKENNILLKLKVIILNIIIFKITMIYFYITNPEFLIIHSIIKLFFLFTTRSITLN